MIECTTNDIHCGFFTKVLDSIGRHFYRLGNALQQILINGFLLLYGRNGLLANAKIECKGILFYTQDFADAFHVAALMGFLFCCHRCINHDANILETLNSKIQFPTGKTPISLVGNGQPA